MDIRTTIDAIKTHPWSLPASVGVASGAVGFALGYFIAERRTINMVEFCLEEDFDIDVILPENFEEAYQKEAKPDATDDILEVVEEETTHSKFVIPKEQYDLVVNEKRDPSTIVPAIPEDEDEVEEFNVWDEVPVVDPDWNWDEEKKKREKATIYPIHKDEFFGRESEYSQTTLTFYAGDNVLTDERDVPLYSITDVLGNEEIDWGHGSGDESVIYIRNVKLRAEYEVVKHEGRFEIEVLGMDEQEEYEEAELKHSRHTIHKFHQE